MINHLYEKEKQEKRRDGAKEWLEEQVDGKIFDIALELKDSEAVAELGYDIKDIKRLIGKIWKANFRHWEEL